MSINFVLLTFRLLCLHKAILSTTTKAESSRNDFHDLHELTIKIDEFDDNIVQDELCHDDHD